jgi:hypothetical protein
MKKLIIVFALAGFLPARSLAQNQRQPAASDTLKPKNMNPGQTPAAAQSDSSKLAAEMELESISIEAIIEKPNVDIIPKRLAPELEEVEFVERSFDRELKEAPKDLLLLDDDLDRVAKLEGLKKLLEQKKKKQEK